MVSISLETDIKQVTKKAGRFYRKQVPFAVSLAMNKTTEDIQKVERAAARRELDQPTPQTVKGIRSRQSNKRNLAAAVFIIPAIDKFLKYQIRGGKRPPRGKVEAIPSELKLNRYGNIAGRRGGRIAKLLARRDTFEATVGGVTGIWQRGRGRNRSRVKLLIVYGGETKYKPRFRFFDHAKRTTKRRWSRNFNKAMTFAVKTAR